jgi:hypothetical protein
MPAIFKLVNLSIFIIPTIIEMATISFRIILWLLKYHPTVNAIPILTLTNSSTLNSKIAMLNSFR